MKPYSQKPQSAGENNQLKSNKLGSHMSNTASGTTSDHHTIVTEPLKEEEQLLALGETYLAAGRRPNLASFFNFCPASAACTASCRVYSSSSHFTEPRLHICIEMHSSAAGLWLRSLEKCDIRAWKMRTCFGDRAVPGAGTASLPRFDCWLRDSIADSAESLKFKLKTHLFSKAYSV